MLHLTALALTYFIFIENKVYFIISEAVIIVSAVIAWQLYSQLIQPLKTLLQGVEAIKDRDFNVKFLLTGKHEMDELIGVYNQMMDELRNERTRQEQQHFFLEKLIYTSPTGIVILDYDDNVQQINPKALQILDLKTEDVLNYPVDKSAHLLLKQIKLLKSGETVVVKPDGVNTYKLQNRTLLTAVFRVIL